MTRDSFCNLFPRQCTGRLFFLVGVVLVILLQLPLPGYSQRFFELDYGRKRVNIPFNLHRNLIVIPVHLNGKGPFNFVLDTGVGMGLITNPKLADSLNFTKGPQIQVTGAGSREEDLSAYIIPGLQIQGPGFHTKGITLTALSQDVFNLSSYVGMSVDGILGYQFFNSFVVRINFTESVLSLYQPEKFTAKKRDGVRVPLELIEQKPYVMAQTTLANQEKIQTKLILDTGAGHALSLEQNGARPVQIPSPAYRTQLGTGLNGSINGYIGRVSGFQLDKFTFKNMLTSFPDFADVGAKVTVADRNGNLGNEFLKRFQVVIDYSRDALYLNPNHLYKDKFEHDMCGVEIIAAGNDYKRFIISRVEPGMPAHEAGVEPGDEIMFINSIPARDLTITKIDKLFKQRDGHKLMLLLNRNSRTLYRFVVLRRRI